MPMQTLPVNEIFHSIQGEGVHQGKPCVFVRLQGCDVGCGWCDTKYTWSKNEEAKVPSLKEKTAPHQWCEMTSEEISKAVSQYPTHHVVITGGEPCQYDLNDLIDTLHKKYLYVQIETSGTEIPPKCDWITVSPKVGMPGGKIIQTQALKMADEIKHPVGKLSDVTRLEYLVKYILPGTPILVQPLSLSKRATEICIETCKKNNWRLSAQLHKYVGVE